MKSLRCTLRFEESAMHPVHRRLTRDEALVNDQLLHSHRADDGRATLLFYVEGDRDAYAEALEETDRIVDYRITPLDDEACYAYIRERSSEFDMRLEDTFQRPGLLVIPPVEFHSDGTARLTAVGEPEALQTALEDLPGNTQVDIERVGDYGTPEVTAGVDLTDRQFEAVVAAFDAGYYDVPRAGTIEEVGERLDCAPGTASEHLRKAERAAMGALLNREP
jgi:predicted DNA binding protein